MHLCLSGMKYDTIFSAILSMTCCHCIQCFHTKGTVFIHKGSMYIYVYVSRKKDLSTRLEQRSRYSSACIPSLSIGTAVHAKLIWLICTCRLIDNAVHAILAWLIGTAVHAALLVLKCMQTCWYCSACNPNLADWYWSACSLTVLVLQCMQPYSISTEVKCM